jgi:hypothetical protein
MFNEAVMAYFEALSRRLSEENGERSEGDRCLDGNVPAWAYIYVVKTYKILG